MQKRFKTYDDLNKRMENMVSRKVILRNQKEIMEFISLVERYPYSVDISTDHCIMNAKSLLGMLAMGLNRVMRMDIYADNADDLLRDVNKFVCTEFGKAV